MPHADSRAYDTIVIGLGAAGAATLYQLAKRGQRVLGIDRHDPPHPHGSTHGETRLTRCAIGEGEEYVPFALRSHEIWRELEAGTGAELLSQTGMLMMADRDQQAGYHGKADFMQRTIAAARRFAIAHEVLDAGAISARFPQMRLTGNEIGYYEPGGGFVYPERCVTAQLQTARKLGAATLCDTIVTGIEADGPHATRVRIEDGESYVAANIVVAAGAWTPALIGGAYRASLTITRQVFDWFDVANPADFAPEVFPTFIWMHGPTAEEAMYGFPIPRGASGIKIGTEQFIDISAAPEAVRREVSAAETQRMFDEHIAGRLPGVAPTALRSTTCLYTFTPDGDFLIDRAEGHQNVLVVSPCSGHGFKHSAALGETIARQVTEGMPAAQLSTFGSARLRDLAYPA
jgi:sarcosine oxidase